MILMDKKAGKKNASSPSQLTERGSGVRFLTAIKKKVRYPGEQLLLFGKTQTTSSRDA